MKKIYVTSTIYGLSGQVVSLLRKHQRMVLAVAGAFIALVTLMLVLSTRAIQANKQYVLSDGSDRHFQVGIVLGAGVTKQGKPFKELQARLDTAAAVLQAGQVDKLVLSGDNRFKGYDEPTAMVEYLVTTKHIDRSKLQPDYAGRSTYESCERAAKVFKIKRAVIISAPSHLPRAIYLCRHFGVESYGISSGADAQNAWRREPLASVKAVYNIYVRGEKTLLGAPIRL